jgi:hypothetical protein
MNNNTQHTPTARKNGLVVRKLKDEVLIYDVEAHQAHCLNLSAAEIWERCDGSQTVSDLSSTFTLDGNVSEHQREQMVWVALDQLEKANLLNKPVPKPEIILGMSRRQLMKTAGIAALIAIPIVSTILAPTAAQASTCLASGQGCGVSAQCCSGLCSAGVCV